MNCAFVCFNFTLKLQCFKFGMCFWLKFIITASYYIHPLPVSSLKLFLRYIHVDIYVYIVYFNGYIVLIFYMFYWLINAFFRDSPPDPSRLVLCWLDFYQMNT